MSEDEIKVTALESVADARLTVSATSGAIVPKRVIYAQDAAQGTRVSVQSENQSVVSNRPEVRKTSVSAHDVAAFILQQRGEMTAMKLQKLVYYSQAWSLVWDEEPLFGEQVEAWANGPVVRELYRRHQGNFKVRDWDGDPSKLNETQRETILKVLEFYGPMAAQVLSDLTHNEDPWLKARAGLAVGDRGSRVISHADMAEYYSSL